MTEVKLEAQERTVFGTAATRRLRKSNQVPLVVYAAGKKNPELRLSVDGFALKKVFGTAEFRQQVLCLVVGKKTYKVKLKTFSRHCVRDDVMHLDFQHAAAA